MPASHTTASLSPGVFGRPSAEPSFPVSATDTASHQAFRLRDIYDGGRGRINSTVKVKGTPNYAVVRRVRLIRERDGRCIRETWSEAGTGNYLFEHIDERERYTVVAYDHTHNFRAVIADNLTPDLMP